MSEHEDELERRVAAMTVEEIIAELDKGNPNVAWAALGDGLIDAGLTNADIRALLAAALRRSNN